MHPHNNQTEPDFEVRHRNPLATDYVIVSRVVLVGYQNVSDGAKLTYWVIYSHDWYEQGSGRRKGFVYPTIRRIAQLRHATERTIQRHLSELISVGLLTREERPGRPSILYIEEPGEDEVEHYLEAQNRGGDKNVTPPPTEMSPHKKEEVKKEKAVNGIAEETMEEVRTGTGVWQAIGSVLSDRSKKVSQDGDRAGWLANEILRQVGDPTSLGCYRMIADRCREATVFEALSLLKEARRDGTALRSRGAFFVSTVRRLSERGGYPDPLSRSQPTARTEKATLAASYEPASEEAH